jgi:integrase
VFLYNHVLGIELGEFGETQRARKPEKLPTVMTQEEVVRILAAMTGSYHLMAKFLYGCGLRLMECARLRVKDIDFDRGQVIVRDGKGMKDRVTILPEGMKPVESNLFCHILDSATDDMNLAVESGRSVDIIQILPTVRGFRDRGDHGQHF